MTPPAAVAASLADQTDLSTFLPGNSLQRRERRIEFGREVLRALHALEDAKLERNIFERVAERYYAGQQYLVPVMRGGSASIHCDKRIRYQLNVMGGVLDMMLAAILSQEAFPEGVPNSSDIEDRMAADVVTAVCREHDQRTPVDRLRTRRMLSVLLGGDSFCRLRYDPSQLATVILSADEAELFGQLTETRPVSWTQLPGSRIRFLWPLGGVTEHNVSASLVYPEHGVESWEDVSRYLVVDYMAIGMARRFWPDVEFRAVDAMDTRGAPGAWSAGSGYLMSGEVDSQTGTRVSRDAAMTLVVTLWERRSDGFWDSIVFTGEGLDVEVDRVSGFVTNPLIHYGGKTLAPGVFWGKGHARDMLAPQYSFNLARTMQMELFMRRVKDVVLMPRGATRTKLTDAWMQVIDYDAAGGMAPQFVSVGAEVLERLGAMAAQFRAELMEIGQVSDAMRGIAGERQSGRAVESLIRSNSTPLLQFRASFMRSEAQKYRAIAALMQEYASMERLVAATGRFGESEVREFKGADIAAGADVRIQFRETDEATRMARLETGIKLQQYGGIFGADPETARRRLFSFVDGGDDRAIRPPDERRAEEQALRERNAIIDGRATLAPIEFVPGPDGRAAQAPPSLIYADTGEPLLAPDQHHEIHAERHSGDINEPSLLTPVTRELMRIHLAGHQLHMRMAAEAAKAEALEMSAKQSLADAAGTIAATRAAAEAKAQQTGGQSGVKGSAAGGGRESGRTRAAGRPADPKKEK